MKKSGQKYVGLLKWRARWPKRSQLTIRRRCLLWAIAFCVAIHAGALIVLRTDEHLLQFFQVRTMPVENEKVLPGEEELLPRTSDSRNGSDPKFPESQSGKYRPRTLIPKAVSDYNNTATPSEKFLPPTFATRDESNRGNHTPLLDGNSSHLRREDTPRISSVPDSKPVPSYLDATKEPSVNGVAVSGDNEEEEESAEVKGGECILTEPSAELLQLLGSFPAVAIENGPSFTNVFMNDERWYIAVDCNGTYSVRSSDDQIWTPMTDPVIEFRGTYTFVECNGMQNALLAPPTLDLHQKHGDASITAHISDTDPAVDVALVDDVVILILDAISRAHFEYQFPETLAFIRSLKELKGSSENGKNETQKSENRKNTMVAYEFEHHLVVGHNTLSNTGALFGGIDEEASWNIDQSFPSALWVFDEYKALGFETLWCEDVEVGNTVPEAYWNALGKEPMRHRCDASFFDAGIDEWRWDSCKFVKRDDPEFQRYQTQVRHDTGERQEVPTYFSGTSFCTGQLPNFRHAMDYMNKLHDLKDGASDDNETKSLKTFSVVVLDDTHEPSQIYESMDSQLRDTLKILVNGRTSKNGSNVAIFLLSDHGIHYGEEFEDLSGWIHHKNPPFFALLPENLLVAQPAMRKALQTNQRTLTTPFDLYETLFHILYGHDRRSFSQELIDRLFRAFPESKDYGRSLLTPLNVQRTCADAGVPEEYCPCGFQLGCPGDGRKRVEDAVQKTNSYVRDRFVALNLPEICLPLAVDELEHKSCVTSGTVSMDFVAAKDDRIFLVKSGSDIQHGHFVQVTAYEKDWANCLRHIRRLINAENVEEHLANVKHTCKCEPFVVEDSWDASLWD